MGTNYFLVMGGTSSVQNTLKGIGIGSCQLTGLEHLAPEEEHEHGNVNIEELHLLVPQIKK